MKLVNFFDAFYELVTAARSFEVTNLGAATIIVKVFVKDFVFLSASPVFLVVD